MEICMLWPHFYKIPCVRYTREYTEEVKVTQLCLTLCDTMDYTVHVIPQARILGWVSFPSPRNLPNTGVKPRSPALQLDSLPAESQGKSKNTGVCSLYLLQQILQPRDQTRVSCIAGGLFTNWAIREALTSEHVRKRPPRKQQWLSLENKFYLLYFSLLFNYATLLYIIFIIKKRLNVFTYWANENAIFKVSFSIYISYFL